MTNLNIIGRNSEEFNNPLFTTMKIDEIIFSEDEIEDYINKVEDLQDTIEQGHPHYVYFS
jgi:hypothetical protein